MKFKLFIFFVIVSFNLTSQDYQLIFDAYNHNYSFQWKGIQSLNSFELKSTFIQYANENGLLQSETEFFNMNPSVDDLSNSLFVVDFNNDGFDDIIFSGYSGGEHKIVKFFLNKENTFKLVFHALQSIVKVDWHDEKISTIYIHDWGCCADNRVINSVYNVNYDEQNHPRFHKIFQSVEFDFMKKPLEYFPKSFDFVVENDNYNIRFQPFIDDSTLKNDDINEFRLGNIIGYLSKSTEGTAYGMATDNTGRIWWYVSIKPNYNVHENILYMKDLDFPTSVIGWVSSNYVSKINSK